MENTCPPPTGPSLKKRLACLGIACAIVALGWLAPTPEGLSFAGKMALATALMAVGAWAVAGLTEGLLPGKAGELLTLGASAAAGVAVYFPAAVLLRLEEGQLALKMVKRVWKRG